MTYDVSGGGTSANHCNDIWRSGLQSTLAANRAIRQR